MKKVTRTADLKVGAMLKVKNDRVTHLRDGIYTVQSQCGGSYISVKDENGVAWSLTLSAAVEQLEWNDMAEAYKNKLKNIEIQKEEILNKIEKYSQYSSEEEYTASKLVKILAANDSKMSESEKILAITKILTTSSETSLL